MNQKVNFIMKPKTITILLFALLSIIILIQNSKVVILRLLFWQITIPVIILILLVLIAGFVLGCVITRQYYKKQS